MDVIYSLYLEHKEFVYEFQSFNDVLKKSDFISVHVPYDKEYWISNIVKSNLILMKNGVYLINCARGKVVDEEALLNALDYGKVAGAGIRCF